MVMDQFVTTYRKDYLWPYVRTLGLKPEPPSLFKPPGLEYEHAGPMCPCKCIDNQPSRHLDKVIGPNALKEQEWSRLAPMGPLLDPKLYPAKVGPAPEVESMRFNQPNAFMQKLQEKYPFIYEILRTAPPDDRLSRINKDRLRTTYQVDFCKLQEYPSAPYDELLRSAGVQGLPPCPEPVNLPGDPYRPNQRSAPFRPNVVKKAGGLSKGARGSGITVWNPFAKDRIWHDDVTENLGKMIYRDTLHTHGRGFIKKSRKKY